MIHRPVSDDVRASQKPLERGAFVVLEFRAFFARMRSMNEEIIKFKQILKRFILPTGAILLLGMGIYAYTYWREGKIETGVKNQETKTQTSVDPDIKVETVGTSTSSDKKPTEPPPSLSRAITNSAKVPDASFLQIKVSIESLIQKIVKDPYSFDSWVQLGVARKSLGDYEGAEQAYQYALLIRPDSFIARSNLVDIVDPIYKDYPRAEGLYREMTEVYPSRLDTFRRLYEMYRYRYTEKKDLADDVLLEGLKRSETNGELLITLARYYKETGHLDLARPYYEKLLQIIHESGDVKLEEAVRSEM